MYAIRSYYGLVAHFGAIFDRVAVLPLLDVLPELAAGEDLPFLAELECDDRVAGDDASYNFV